MSRSIRCCSRRSPTTVTPPSCLNPPKGTPPAILDYEEYIADVDTALIAVARRHRLTESEAEELRSETWLKLLRDGGRVLRRFRGKARLQTYLATVIRNVLRDQRNKEWGKWRPSSAARRFGPTGVAIDRLLHRDQVPLDAIEHYVVGQALDVGTASVQQIAAALPTRYLRRFVGDGDLAAMPSLEPSPFEVACVRERRLRQQEIKQALARALTSLSSHERSLIVSRYVRGESVAEWARLKGENHKCLYRRFTRILQQLRTRLEFEGISSADAEHAPNWVFVPRHMMG